ncbi:hypothetical protein RM697_13115 [Ichthyenterobacterium sp. W332]|uniref:Uncharacterized protein n=1 Tax=Microcosmobacter mediterraneus TaxID=3075607 RepID=A0ABU2YN47_9FLAO|nr:hypothetical protein [Ichthyenterobacterium sp. W332]MDT0559593.1 hypothetical protein [Ichthyenterobacterium sp. W332]
MNNSKSKLLAFLCLALLLVNTTCNEDDLPINEVCDYNVVINQMLYNEIDNENSLTIQEAILNDNCLELLVSASGCDGESWEFALVDSGDIAESSPIQRFLKLNFTNNEACLAVITRVVSFDISDLQMPNENEVLLNIEDLSESFLYQY